MSQARVEPHSNTVYKSTTVVADLASPRTDVSLEMERLASNLFDAVVEDPGNAGPPKKLAVDVPLDAKDSGPDAMTFIEEVLNFLKEESLYRHGRYRVCRTVSLVCHSLILFLFSLEILLISLSEVFMVMPKGYTAPASLVASALSMIMLHLVRRASEKQSKHRVIYTMSSAIYTKLVAKRGVYLSDGFIDGREFHSIQADFIAYTQNRKRILEEPEYSRVVAEM